MLSIDGNAAVKMADHSITAGKDRVKFMGTMEKPSGANGYKIIQTFDYCSKVRMWENDTQLTVADIQSLAFQDYADIPTGIDWSKNRLLFLLTDSYALSLMHGKGTTVLSPIGVPDTFFPDEMKTTAIPCTGFSGPGKRKLSDITVIEMWVKPDYIGNGKPNSQCVFEISTGKEIGEMFGLYISEIQYQDVYDMMYLTSGTGTPAPALPAGEDFTIGPCLDFKSSRLGHVFTKGFFNVNRLVPGRFNHIFLYIKKKKKSSDCKIIVGINGLFKETDVKTPSGGFTIEDDYDLVFDTFRNLQMNHISIGESLSGSNAFKGEMIGPRFWVNEKLERLESVVETQDKIAAYAYTDFRNFNCFGNIQKQHDLFGRLAGMMFEIPGAAGAAAKPAYGFYLLAELSKNMAFLPNGIQIESDPKKRIYEKIYDKADCISDIDLGQVTYPFPLKEFIKGHPVDLMFSQIGIIDFWIRLTNLSTAAEIQTIFEITGFNIINDKKVNCSLTFGFNSDKSSPKPAPAFFVKKTYNDIELQAVPIQSLNPTNDLFHHICLNFNDLVTVNTLHVRINGGQPAIAGGGAFLNNFEFKVDAVYIASSKDGDQLLNAEMCGPRIWNGTQFSEPQYHAVPFIHYFTDPGQLIFTKQKEIAKVTTPVIPEPHDDLLKVYEYFYAKWSGVTPGAGPVNDILTKADIDKYQYKHKPPGKEVTFVKLPHEDRFNGYLGTWVFEQEDKVIPELRDLKDDQLNIISREEHCFYSVPTYISFVKNPSNHLIYLVADTDLKIVEVPGNESAIEFIDEDSQKHVCTVYLNKMHIPHYPDIDEELPSEYNAIFVKIASDNIYDLKFGSYKRPYRKPLWPGEKASNIFLQRLPNFDSLLIGTDITELDPGQYFDFEATKGNPIFRVPPSDSACFDLHQGVTVPFGWNYVPFVSYNADTKSKMLTTSSEMEKATSNSITHKSSTDNKTSGTAGIPEVFAVKASLEIGFNSESNREIASRTKDLEEQQSFASSQQWFCTSHDLVLDRPNILFSGQFVDGDDPEDFDFTKGFYTDIHHLKLAEENNSSTIILYNNLIKAYGTHYLAAVRFGSKGWRIHQFTEKTREHLQDNNIKISHVDGSKVGVGVGASGGFDGFSAGLEDQLNIESSTGTALTSQQIEDVKNKIRNEEEQSGSRGSYSEGSVDHMGEIHVLRYLEPIYELLKSPYFSDYTINKIVMPKLKKAFDDYLLSKKGNWPKAEYMDDYYEITVDVDVDYKLPWDKQKTEKNHNGVYQGYDNVNELTEYQFTCAIEIETGGQSEKFDTLPIGFDEIYTTNAQLIVNERLRIYNNGTLETLGTNKRDKNGNIISNTIGQVVSVGENEMVKVNFSGVFKTNVHATGRIDMGWFHKDKNYAYDYPNSIPVSYEKSFNVDFKKSPTYTFTTEFGTVTVSRQKITI
ncbi:MAG: MAC/perforin domain-containing protein [Chitinophagales bacterium]